MNYIRIDPEFVGPSCHYLEMDEVKGVTTAAGQTARLRTEDLKGCQATVLVAALQEDKAALLAHVSPQHYEQTSEMRHCLYGFDIAEQVRTHIADHPLLQNERAKQSVVLYYHDESPPWMPSLQELKDTFHLPFQEEDVRLIPYKRQYYNAKAVRVDLPAEVGARSAPTWNSLLSRSQRTRQNQGPL